MRSLLVVPIDPALVGNGLAHRARMWQRILANLGDVTTIVANVWQRRDEVTSLVEVVMPLTSQQVVSGTMSAFADVQTRAVLAGLGDQPSLAQLFPYWLGRSHVDGEPVDLEPVDIVIGMRAYLGPYSVGLRSLHSAARLVIDLDDDDVAFHRSLGDELEAAAYERLVDWLGRHADMLVDAHSVGSQFEVGMTPTGVIAVPNAVDVPALQPRHLRSGGTSHIVMVGNFHYEPNAEGAAWFIDEVLPLVRTRRSARLLLAGPGSESFEQRHPAVVALGTVDDLDTVYERADLAVVPILHGSGTRIKALEAWAAGVPLVGTSVGVSGLHAVNGEQVLIADSAAEFADAVLRGLADGPLAERLRISGWSLVHERYSMQRVVSQTSALLFNLAHAAVPVKGKSRA